MGNRTKILDVYKIRIKNTIKYKNDAGRPTKLENGAVGLAKESQRAPKGDRKIAKGGQKNAKGSQNGTKRELDGYQNS